jgi:hypothetical protein
MGFQRGVGIAPKARIAEGGPVGFPTGGTDGTGSASFPKPRGFQGGMPLWSQDTFRCPRRGGSEALEGGTRSGSPSKGPRGPGAIPTPIENHTNRDAYDLLAEFDSFLFNCYPFAT